LSKNVKVPFCVYPVSVTSSFLLNLPYCWFNYHIAGYVLYVLCLIAFIYSLERLRDRQVKLGAARYEQYAGSLRRIVNQIRTGTVSRNTLLNVLEIRSEHLWVCPVCKDNNLFTNH
jgi:hypothetical protein